VPRYRFTVRNTDRFDDEDGVFLLDDGAAREYAIQIMDELQKDGNKLDGLHHRGDAEGRRIVWRLPFDRPSLPT